MTFIQTPGNTTQIKITAKERIINIYVKAYHLEDIYNLSRTEITDDSLNISLTNETGITFNRTGNLNSIITTDGIANFTGIHDGTYRINVTGTNYTFDNLTTFNTTAQGFCNEPKIFLKKNQAGYINITIISGSIPLTDATVKLFWNSTTQLSSKTTGNSGRAIFSVNPTIHNSTLYIQASKAGYVTKDTAVFNLTAGEVNSIILSLAVQSTGQTGSSGSSRSRPSIISSPNITENETAAQKNVSDQTEREEYKYTETSTEIENSIEQNQDLNNLLEQHFGELSEKDMQEIAQETKNINKYITLTRDIHTDKNGKTVIGLNIYYKKDEPEIVYDFVLYDTLPKELITIDKITFTETAAKIIKDEDSNSYLAIIPKIEKDTYCRIEFTTEEYIDPSKIDALSRPIILSAATKSAETENKTQIQEPEQQETKDKKSILGYWWILALAAFAVSTGIIIINIIKKRKQAKVYSFKPIETKKPLNPPYIPTTNITDAKNIADAPNGFKKAQKIQNIEKKVEKIEKEIAKNIKETAQKNAVYLTKPLEKEKFIVD
ncbi:MAG: carboxypeptidase-like regulatory domain-containing protein [archaeon]|nr:carboxypeptidase-like regulatory domain-containing protein [archaeon]